MSHTPPNITVPFNITVPSDLRDRMRDYPSVSWSRIATQSFREYLGLTDHPLCCDQKDIALKYFDELRSGLRISLQALIEGMLGEEDRFYPALIAQADLLRRIQKDIKNEKAKTTPDFETDQAPDQTEGEQTAITTQRTADSRTNGSPKA